MYYSKSSNKTGIHLSIFLLIIIICSIHHNNGNFFINNSIAGNTSISNKWEIFDGDEKSIKKYLDSAESIDAIEGIYSLSDKHYNKYGALTSKKDNWAKVAIIKDHKNPDRGYIEINLDNDKVPKYAITAEYSKLNETTYLSKQYSLYSKPENVTFTFNHHTGTLYCETTGFLRSTKRFYLKFSNTNAGKDEEGNKWSAFGTCFAISVDGYFATNYHVIKKAKTINITLLQDNEKKIFKAKMFLKDESNDIAILKIEDTSFKVFDSIPYVIGEIKNVGEKVFTLGYPKFNDMGSNIKFEEGNINATTGLKDDIRYYQISVPVTHGNSGGPLFTYDGLIVGITSMIYRSDQTENVAYALKSHYLEGLIKMMPKLPEVIMNKPIGKETNEKEVVRLYQKYIGLVKIVKED
jgi:S1-C subfamily serine protease